MGNIICCPPEKFDPVENMEEVKRRYEMTEYKQPYTINLPVGVIRIIRDYMAPDYVVAWVDYKKLNYHNLSLNPNAVHQLYRHVGNNIDWYNVSANRNAINILKKHPDKIDIKMLCRNINGEELLISLLDKHKEYEDSLDWWELSGNPGMINFLKKNKKKIITDRLCGNSGAIELIEELLLTPNVVDKINKSSQNHSRNHLINHSQNQTINNEDKEDEKYIFVEKKHIFTTSSTASFNTTSNIDNDNIEEETKYINWYWLSRNSAAMHILKYYPSKIDWNGLSLNTNREAVQMLSDNYMYSHNLCKKLDDDYNINSTNNRSNNEIKNNTIKYKGNSSTTKYKGNIAEEIKKYATTEDKINYRNLCMNPAAKLLLYSVHKYSRENIFWKELSGNSGAVTLLYDAMRNYPEVIDYNIMSFNEGIFDDGGDYMYEILYQL